MGQGRLVGSKVDQAALIRHEAEQVQCPVCKSKVQKANTAVKGKWWEDPPSIDEQEKDLPPMVALTL
jgi:hypothetical protein